MKTLRNGYLCVKVAYLKSKRITVLINTVAHGRNRPKFDLDQSNQPQNSSILLLLAPPHGTNSYFLRFVPFYFHLTPYLSVRYTSTHH